MPIPLLDQLNVRAGSQPSATGTGNGVVAWFREGLTRWEKVSLGAYARHPGQLLSRPGKAAEGSFLLLRGLCEASKEGHDANAPYAMGCMVGRRVR